MSNKRYLKLGSTQACLHGNTALLAPFIDVAEGLRPADWSWEPHTVWSRDFLSRHIPDGQVELSEHGTHGGE